MDRWRDRALQYLALASASAALPGGMVVIAYSIHNAFFPYLVDTVSAAKLGFVSVVVAFIFLVGLAYGTALSLWLVVLLVEVRPGRRGRHIMLPSSAFERRFYGCVSFVAFASSAFLAWAGTRRSGDPALAYLLCYFVVTGFVMSAVVDPVDGSRRTFRRLLPLAAVLPFAMLPIVSGAIVPLLNLCMSTMGFRSAPSDLVLVDDAAYRRLEDTTAPVDLDRDDCMMQLGSRTMWFLRGGVVVWTGSGDDTLVSAGRPGPAPLRLAPDQVVTLRRQDVPGCLDED